MTLQLHRGEQVMNCPYMCGQMQLDCPLSVCDSIVAEGSKVHLTIESSDKNIW